MEFLSDYGLFFAKAVTLVICLIVVLSIIMSFRQREGRSEKGHIEVTRLNERYDNMAETLKHAALDPEQLKLEQKAEKKKAKQEKATQKKEAKAKAKAEDKAKDKAEADEQAEQKKRLYVLNFDGDIHANATDHLREEITTVLSLATAHDEVVVRLESPGGVVHGYGLAASQLSRIKSKGIPLTVCVDKVAASGGYMMACVADKILAAPFAILGSIGVMAEVPNFNRLLKKAEIDYDVYTAGEFKRTVTRFGENTEKGKEKFKEDLETTHQLFKQFVSDQRPVVDINKVATGEIWFGSQALEQELVDQLITSDDYISQQSDSADIYEIVFTTKQSLPERLGLSVQQSINSVISTSLNKLQFFRFM